MFNSTDLKEKIRLGIKRVGEVENQGFMKAVEIIAKEIGIGTSTLRSWADQPRRTSLSDSLLAKFVLACISKTTSLDYLWVDGLFTANGTELEMLQPTLTNDLLAVLESRSSTSILETFKTIQKYKMAVQKWAQWFVMFGNRRGTIYSRGSVDASIQRIYRNTVPFADLESINNRQLYENPEDLIREKRIQAVITSPTGGGKTVLLHYLSWLLSVQKQGPLPVPIDWGVAEGVDDTVVLIRKSIKKSIPRNLLPVIEDEVNELANFLNSQLSQGLAIGLVDNWSDSPSTKLLLNECLSNWDRVIVFARYPPAFFDTPVQLYKLSNFNLEEARQFVLKWPEITGNQIDTYKVSNDILNYSGSNQPYLTPLFLDLFCYRAYKGAASGEISFWELIRWVVDEMIEKEVGVGSNYARFDLALAELAFLRLTTYQREGKSIRETYLPAELDLEWQRKFGVEGKSLFDVAYTKGFLRDVSDKQVIRFPHPAIEAYFAAKAWLLKDNFIESIGTFKRSYFLSDMMVAAATILEKRNEINLLVTYIKAIRLSSGGNSNTEDYILAWNCYSTLSIETKEKIKASGVGEVIEDDILNLIFIEKLDKRSSIGISWYPNRNTKRMKQKIISIIIDKKRDGLDRYHGLNLVKPSLGKEDIAWLIGLVRDPEEEENVQVLAINALGRVKDPSAVITLNWIISHTKHKDHAYAALVTHNSVDAVNAITSQSSEFHCLDFSGFTNPEVVPLFRKILSENAHPNPSILEALIKIHTREAIDLLSEYLYCPLLCEDKRIGVDFHKYVSEKVVWLLAESNSPIAYEALLSFIESKTELINTKCMAIIAISESFQLVDSYRLVKVLLEDPIWNALPITENDPFEDSAQILWSLSLENKTEEWYEQGASLDDSYDESQTQDINDKEKIISPQPYDYSWSAIRVRYSTIENGNWSQNPDNLALFKVVLKRTKNPELMWAIKQAIQKFD